MSVDSMIAIVRDIENGKRAAEDSATALLVDSGFGETESKALAAFACDIISGGCRVSVSMHLEPDTMLRLHPGCWVFGRDAWRKLRAALDGL